MLLLVDLVLPENSQNNVLPSVFEFISSPHYVRLSPVSSLHMA